MEEILIVLTTVPDAEVGARLARRLVEENLAACVNLLPGVRSFYVWEGELQDDAELLLIAKVRADRFGAYERRLVELHPYSVPEVVGLPVAVAHAAYVEWRLRG